MTKLSTRSSIQIFSKFAFIELDSLYTTKSSSARSHKSNYCGDIFITIFEELPQDMTYVALSSVSSCRYYVNILHNLVFVLDLKSSFKVHFVVPDVGLPCPFQP